MHIPGSFLGSRADALTEVVFLAIVLILPVMFWSVSRARARQYASHRAAQVTLTLLLTVVVGAFETNIRAQGGVFDMARESPYIRSSFFNQLFIVHLIFASLTAAIWLGLVGSSLWKLKNLYQPSTFRRLHRVLGWMGVVGMTGTGLTGGVFFILAFWS